MKNMKKQTISVLAICLILLNISVVYTSGRIIGDQTENLLYANPGNFLGKRVAIIYDPVNINAEETARAIHETVYFLYSNVQLIQVYTPDMLLDTFGEDYWVRIYVFNTDLDGLITAGGILNWKSLSKYFNYYDNSHHICVFGNSYKAAELVSNSKCYFEQKEVVDARTGYLHAVWTLADVFESEKEDLYLEIGSNFRKIAVQYFAEELENLVSAEFDPTYGLGEQDSEKAEERIQQFKLDHPDQLYKVHPETGELVSPTAVIPGFDPALNLVPKADAEENNDIILTDFPFLSSISGASGDVIKLLLDLIGVEIPDGVITVGVEFANSIKSIINEIPKIIGFLKDPSASSALESFFDILRSAFPALQEYKPYFDIATKAIFAIRDGPAGILGLIDDLLLFLIPESAQEFVGNITNALNLTTEFWDGMLNTDNWADYLMKHLNRQVIYQIMWKVAELIGGSFNITSVVD
ncbi:MAG: hypothetical protein KAS63_07200, partial [Candidatus Heimdallarchaeota archaeon]|nr:hypothetical protein [Candidatus Heimdallarchaeota archaeon]MCK4955133.1 hypothetical protein [Candidatus Heimdallarchaeota archaeon]